MLLLGLDWGVGVSYLANGMLTLEGLYSVPSGVEFRTALRRRSPELTAESWGNRFMRRSAWVPLPTPGAPTSMIRAARLNSLVAIFWSIYSEAEQMVLARFEGSVVGKTAHGSGGWSKLEASVSDTTASS